MTPSVTGKRHDEARADAELTSISMRAAEVFDRSAHDVEANSASRGRGHLVAGAESRLEQDGRSSACPVTWLSGGSRPRSTAASRRALLVDAIAVIADLDDDRGTSSSGRNGDRRLSRLAGGQIARPGCRSHGRRRW